MKTFCCWMESLFTPGQTLSGDEVAALVKKSPNLANASWFSPNYSGPPDPWERYLARFGIEGEFKTGVASVEILRKYVEGGYLRMSANSDKNVVADKAKSGKLNTVTITKEPGRLMLVVDGNHSLKAAIQRGDKTINVIVASEYADIIFRSKDETV